MRSRWIIPVLLFCCVTGFLTAFEWPVEEKNLTATFGEHRWGNFLSGIDLSGAGQEVHPADDGELIYYIEEHKGFGSLPSGLGSFVVLEHQRGLRTLYGHLDGDSIHLENVRVTVADVIAETGNSGASIGPHLYFQVIDREFDQLVNPLLILPPLRDTRRPVLEYVQLLRNRERIDLENKMTVPAGTYELLLSIYDPSEFVRYFKAMTPYKIQVYVNGEQTVFVSFEKLQHKDGKIFLIQSDEAGCDDFFFQDQVIRFGGIQLPPGDVILEILAEDIFRNSLAREFRIRVVE